LHVAYLKGTASKGESLPDGGSGDILKHNNISLK